MNDILENRFSQYFTRAPEAMGDNVTRSSMSKDLGDVLLNITD